MKNIRIPILIGLSIGIFVFIKFQLANTTEYVDATEIDLSDSTLHEIPLSVFYATKLEKLNLANTSLHQLPDKIKNLQELRYLDLSSNSFRTLPQSIEALQKLEYLDISRNSIEELPEVICSLKNLKILKANQYRLTQLPECICEMKLDSFFIAWEYLEKLPENIANFDFPTLFELNSYNKNKGAFSIFNRIDEIHPKLKKLHLRHSDLDSLPIAIGNLTQLRELNLNIIFDPLTEKQRELPNIFEKTTKLETFIAKGNYFSKYPPSFQELRNLRHLSISDYIKPDQTLFTAINNFKKLEYLKLEYYAFDRELSKFHFDLSDLKELKTLDLKLNFKELPLGSLSQLKKLEYLRIYMPTRTFKEDFSKLKQLKYLDLSLFSNDNIELVNLPTLENLETLILDAKIEQLPYNIGDLQQLRYLKIDAPIQQFPESFANLNALDTFYCLTHFVSGIPDVIYQLKNLKVLFLAPFGNIYNNKSYKTALNPNFVKLKNLEDLYISSLNNLSFALSIFSKLDSLKEVSIRNSKLEQDWQHLLQENNSITHLNMRSCQLESLPDDLEKLNSLELLNLSRNAFTVFPMEVLNTNIKILDLSYNRLQEFPSEFNKSSYALEKLDLSNNNLTEIPTAILEISTLKELHLNGNNFNDIDPNLFKGKLPMLEILYIDQKWANLLENRLKEHLPNCTIYSW